LSSSPVTQCEQGPDVLPKKRYLTPHLIVLSICSVILIGALLLSPAESGEGHLTIGSITLPDTCTFKNLTGLPCPGCGLTRSLVAAAHGDLRDSFHHHRLGLLTLLYVLLQFVFRIGAIAAPALTLRIFGPEKYLNRGIVILAALFLLNWIYRLVF
jgi:preprotein translocase subunit SecG